MWFKLPQFVQSYIRERDRKAFKSKIETLTALELPKAYIGMVKSGKVEKIDRQRKIETSIANAQEIIDWVNSVAFDLVNETMSTVLPPPGTTGRQRSVRIDSLLYVPKYDRYVDLEYVFSEIADAYTGIKIVLSDKNHPTHYRAKDRIMPHINRLHELFISIID